MSIRLLILLIFPNLLFGQSSTTTVSGQPNWGLYVDADSATAKAWARASDSKDRYKNNPAYLQATHNYNAANAVVGNIIPTQASVVQSLHDAGYRGKGIKIALWDVGFSTYTGLSYAGGNGSYLTEPASATVTQHGTTMASIIGERPNGYQGLTKPNGIVGIAYEAELYAIPYTGSTADIQWCIDNGMDIINVPLSLGYNADLANKLQEAIRSGIIVCAASGNSSYNSLQPITWPAALPGIIAVSAHKGGHVFATDTGYVYGNILPVNGKGVDFSVEPWAIGHDNAYDRGSTAHLGTSESVTIFTAYLAVILGFQKERLGIKPTAPQILKYLSDNAQNKPSWGAKQFTSFSFLMP